MKLIMKVCRQSVILIPCRQADRYGPKRKTGGNRPAKIWSGILAAAALFMITSCSHHRQESEARLRDVHSAPEPGRGSEPSAILKQLQAEYDRWQGTPHRLGGRGRSGVDCSGFVKAVYKNVFSMNLPRTTRAQVRLGRPVKKTDLQAGDLVFFKPPSYPRHVGIYLSDSQFAHASKTKGVIISEMTPSYWAKYFWTARRLLEGASSR